MYIILYKWHRNLYFSWSISYSTTTNEVY